MSSGLPDASTAFGKRVAERLRDEHLIWLTTVAADGTPQPNPVWFLWDGESMLIYNKVGARRLAHIARNPRVSLNFESDADGNDVIILTGAARLSPGELPPERNAPYIAKYQESITGSFQTPEHFASLYSVPVRVTIEKVRGF